jgi:hypothetical protein
MFFALVLVAVTGIAIGEVANVPHGTKRITLEETVDCAVAQDEYVAYCAFPERKLHVNEVKGAN